MTLHVENLRSPSLRDPHPFLRAAASNNTLTSRSSSPSNRAYSLVCAIAGPCWATKTRMASFILTRLVWEWVWVWVWGGGIRYEVGILFEGGGVYPRYIIYQSQTDSQLHINNSIHPTNYQLSIKLLFTWGYPRVVVERWHYQRWGGGEGRLHRQRLVRLFGICWQHIVRLPTCWGSGSDKQ